MCKDIENDFKLTSEELKGNVQFANVDVSKNEKIKKKYEILNFPSLILFRNGKRYLQYGGDTNVEVMSSWLSKKAKNPSIIIKEQKDIDEYIKKSKKKVIVGYFISSNDTKFDEFAQIFHSSEIFEDFVFVSNFENKKTLIKIYRSFDDYLTFGGDDFDNFVEFVQFSVYKLFDEITEDNFQRFYSSGLPLVFLFLDYKKPKDDYIRIVEKIVPKFKGKLLFCYTDGKKFKDQLIHMGGNENILPSIAAMNILERKDYLFKDEFKTESIENWSKKLSEGKLKPTIKSEPIPKKNDGNVKIIVGETFDDLVMTNSTNVLLEVYASWCGFCQQFESIYNSLGEKFKNDKDIMIAKIDGDKNAIPINFREYPSIYFLPKENKESLVLYEGDKTLEELTKYVNEMKLKKFDSNPKKDEL
eukprot:gene12007-5407_t